MKFKNFVAVLARWGAMQGSEAGKKIFICGTKGTINCPIYISGVGRGQENFHLWTKHY